jgi:hypothetical protein
MEPSYEDFVLLVKQLREAQTKYFQTREPSYLSESKTLEKAVDAAVADYYELQRKLF